MLLGACVISGDREPTQDHPSTHAGGTRGKARGKLRERRVHQSDAVGGAVHDVSQLVVMQPRVDRVQDSADAADPAVGLQVAVAAWLRAA